MTFECAGCGHPEHPKGECPYNAYITKEKCRCPYDNGRDPRKKDSP